MKKISIAMNFLFTNLFLNLTSDKFLSEEDKFVKKNITIPTFERKWKKIYMQLKEMGLINIGAAPVADINNIMVDSPQGSVFISLTKAGVDRGLNMINNSLNYEKLFKKGNIGNLLAALSFAGAELEKRVQKEGFQLHGDSACFDALVQLQITLTGLLTPFFGGPTEEANEELPVVEEIVPEIEVVEKPKRKKAAAVAA